MLKFPVTINANANEGYSDYHVGQQIYRFLKKKGVDVIVEDKWQKSLFTRAKDRHLISLYTDIVWPYYQYARYGGPKSVLHLQAIGPKVYPENEYLCYLATLRASKMSGIPVAHMHVSPAGERHAMQIARKFFNPSTVRGIDSNSVRNYYGVEKGFKEWKEPDLDHLIAPQNRWEMGSKNLPMHMRLSNLYKTMCVKNDRPYKQTMLFHPDTDFEKVDPLAKQVYEFEPQYMGRTEFKKNIGQFGMFLSTSQRESFGLYFVELLKAGVVGVFHDQEWNRLLLPEYPFRGPEDELVAMMEWVRNNHAEARKMIKDSVIPYIDKMYNEQVYLNGIMDTLLMLENKE